MVQWACSDKGVRSKTEPVKSQPALPSPIPATPIFNGDKSVEILNTVAGARVELYVSQNQGPFVFAGFVDANNISATVIDPTVVLNTGDSVRAQQFLCSASSEPTKPVRVVPAAGPRPFYVVGHNPNTIADVNDALSKGANAIEPDVTYSRAIHPNCASAIAAVTAVIRVSFSTSLTYITWPYSIRNWLSSCSIANRTRILPTWD